MYNQAISRRDPGCIVILLDRSDSMKRPWRDSGMTLAQGAARAINRLLLDLCVKSTKEVGEVREYFHVMVLGYGERPVAGGEGVESALGGALTGGGILPLPELADAPLAVREEPSVDHSGGTSRVPIWVEPVHGRRTPMCQAIAEAGFHVYDWAEQHHSSFPPIVLNVTDGLVTDSPYDGADLNEWATRLTTIETDDGPTLFLNVFLSTEGRRSFFPNSATGLPDPGPSLYAMSSPVPDAMSANARGAGIDVPPGARALCYNADLETLVTFFEVGTRITSVQDR